ncbi:MAG: hypothetical protein ACLPH3_11165 [Terracidiphilus sp.]
MGFLVDRNGKTLGPYARDAVPGRVAAGEIALTDMACDEYAGHWMPLSELLSAEPVEPLTIPNSLSHKRSTFSAIGWGSLLGIAYFFYRIARLMHACARVHPHL